MKEFLVVAKALNLPASLKGCVNHFVAYGT